MHNTPAHVSKIAAVLCGFVLLNLGTTASALPSFARQTGMSCAACHTVFPQLTPFGRQFKLHGYTMTNTTTQQPAGETGPFPPLALMLQSSYTSLKKNMPDRQNDNVQFPDQLSLFYGGRLSDKLGAFLQATYDGAEDHLSMDNADMRFANDTVLGGKSLTYGLTLNNNPTVQDPWNNVPAWGFPYASSPVAPAPAAATQIDGTLAQNVAGLGAYAFFNNSWYGELSLYRSSQIGQNAPPDSTSEDTISGAAPYWRLAYEHNWGPHSLEVGTYGMDVDVYPSGVSGPTNHFRDVALDTQYQYLSGPHIFTLHSTWIHENQDWNASFAAGGTANRSDTLDTFKLDGTYYQNRHWGGTLGFFNTSGDGDPGLYAPAAVDGSRTDKPDSRGWIAELDYLPWENTKFSLQYTAYDRFNGAGSNYDGFGRDAADNNSLYLNAWVMW